MSIKYLDKSQSTLSEVLLAGTPQTDQILSPSSKNAIANKTVYNALSEKVSKTVNDLVNYYTKSDVYNKQEIRELIGAIETLTMEVVNALPSSDISTTTIYLLKQTGSSNYDEYVYINNEWVKIGTTQIDLSGYVTTSQLNQAIADFLTETEINLLLSAKQDKNLSSSVTIGSETVGTVEDAISEVADIVPSEASASNKLATKGDIVTIEIDDSLSSTSENPVQNKVLKSALDAKQPSTLSSPIGGVDTVEGVLNATDAALSNYINFAGAKNMLPCYLGSRLQYGIDFVMNDNGSITMNGTSTGNPAYYAFAGENNGVANSPLLYTLTEIGLNKSLSFKVKIADAAISGVALRIYFYDAEGTIIPNPSASTNYLSCSTSVTLDFSSGYYRNAEYAAFMIAVSKDTVLTDAIVYPLIYEINEYTRNSAYFPWAMTNRDLTTDGLKHTSWTDISKVGAVNFLENNAVTTVDNTAGLTYTVNADKSVTVSATSGTYPFTVLANSNLVLYEADGTESYVGKQIKISGCPKGGSDAYHIQAYRANSVDGSTGTIKEYGNGIIFDWLNDGSGIKAKVSVVLRKDLEMEGPLVFYPMLTLTNYNGDYAPYAKTNKELTDEFDKLTDEIVDDEVYTMRQGKGNLADISNLVGGTVAWNQIVQNGNFSDGTTNWTVPVPSEATMSVSNNKMTYTCIVPSSASSIRQLNTFEGRENHIFIAFADITPPVTTACCFYIGDRTTSVTTVSANTRTRIYAIQKAKSSMSNTNFYVYPNSDSSLSANAVVYFENVNCIDLTQMFGATIADYIYSLEQSNAGDGVAWFRQYFPKAYYAYDAGSLQSVKPSGRKATGGNLKLTLEQGAFTTAGVNSENTTRLRTVGYVEVTPNTIYYIDTDLQHTVNYFATNTNQERLIGESWNEETSFTTPKDCNYIRIMFRYSNDSDVFPEEHYCNVSLTSVEYPISPIDLRGIPKLVDNKLAYDGDLYFNNGSITRKYGIIDLGTLSWGKQTTAAGYRFTGYKSDLKPTASTNDLPDIICPKYTPDTSYNTWNRTNNKTIGINNGDSQTFLIVDTDYTDASTLKTSLSGVYAVYPLSSRTMESAPVFQSPQRACLDGTEEWLDNRDMVVPVGHNTNYQVSNTLNPIEKYVEGTYKKAVADYSELGAINVLTGKFTTTTHNTVVFTVADDNTVSVNGTTSSSNAYIASTKFFVSAGTWKLSGCPKGGSDTSYRVTLVNTSAGSSALAKEYGDGAVFTLESDSLLIAYVEIRPSTTITDLVFKPMVTRVSYKDEYVSSAMTNKGLTTQLVKSGWDVDGSTLTWATGFTYSSGGYNRLGSYVFFALRAAFSGTTSTGDVLVVSGLPPAFSATNIFTFSCHDSTGTSHAFYAQGQTGSLYIRGATKSTQIVATGMYLVKP